mgnify:FL=1
MLITTSITLPGIEGQGSHRRKPCSRWQEVGADTIIGLHMDFEKGYVHQIGTVV